MAWGQEKGADFHISALRACQYEIFDFVPCSLPLKTLILLTFSCFLIRRRGKRIPFYCIILICRKRLEQMLLLLPAPKKLLYSSKKSLKPVNTDFKLFYERRQPDLNW